MLPYVSSQDINSLNVGEFVLNASDTEFAQTSLKVTYKVRVTRLVTVERNLITKRLGKLGVGQLQQLNIAMIQAFQL